MGRGALLPGAAEDIEGVGGDAAHTVVGGAHNEAGPRGYGAEFADNQAVAELGVVKEHVVPFKGRWVVFIVVVGVFAHGDIWGLYNIFYKARGFILVGVYRIRVGYALHKLYNSFVVF